MNEGEIVVQTKGVVFLGTPNVGSKIADWANRLRVLIRPSEATKTLTFDDAHLRDLNIWYRDHSPSYGIATSAFFETRPTHGVTVVDAISADPGVPGVEPIPLDTDHIAVCKPLNRETTLYRTVVRFIEDHLKPRTSLERLSPVNAPASGTKLSEHFDIFISHSNAQKPWVEALARNLLSAGKSVFLDIWQLVPGRDWVDGIRAGLAACRAAILVVSPEAVQSGWVREEFEILKRRQIEDPDFPIIPVIQQDVEGENLFTGSIQWVDFRDERKHPEAFGRLLAGLERRAPGPDPMYDTTSFIALPMLPKRRIAEAARTAIEEAVVRCFNAPAVVILAQEGLGFGLIAEEIRKRAADHFGPDAVVKLTPSYVAPEDGQGPYFESLCAQANLPTDAPSVASFQRHLGARLRKVDHMLLVFTGLEHSPPSALEALCGALRALNEQFANLRVLLCGGERLCEMRYAAGALSYLSHAQEEIWPEPGPAEIIAEARAQDYSELNSQTLKEIADVSGGHRGLVRELVAVARRGEQSRSALEQVVADSPILWAAVEPFRRNEEVSQILRGYVSREDLGKAERFIGNPMLRRLFWLNLLAQRRIENRHRITWRSPAIRRGVHLILTEN
jgi:hypothetical protein